MGPAEPGFMWACLAMLEPDNVPQINWGSVHAEHIQLTLILFPQPPDLRKSGPRMASMFHSKAHIDAGHGF